MQRQSLGGGGGSSPGSKHHQNIHGGGGASSSSSSSSSKEVSRVLFDEEESKEETTPTRKERGVGGVVVVSSDIIIDQEEEEKKKRKMKKKSEKHHLHLHLRSTSISRITHEKSIHLIPILTLFCLLILYLCSYDPPLKDLAHIDGFRRISKRIDDSTEISLELDDDDDHDQTTNIKAADVLLLPIRSHRSLHEIRKDNNGRSRRKSLHRFHRKIGDYSHTYS